MEEGMVLSLFGWVVILFAAGASDIVYDPQIAGIIDAVSRDSLVSTVASLSGEKSATIGGAEDSIPCRYAYSPGCHDAALWLKEQLETRGVNAELDPFVPMTFTDIALLPSGTGWTSASSRRLGIVGTYKYSLFKTEDVGTSWHKVDSTIPWGKIAVLSDDTAWCLAEKKIMRTEDGTIWKEMLNAEELSTIYDLCAVDTKHGWAVGSIFNYPDSKGCFLSTSDGWKSWIIDSSFSEALKHVCFVSLKTGWVASSDSLWITTDSSKTWTKLGQPLKEIIEMEFADSLHGYLLGETSSGKGAIYKTSNAGTIWQVLIDTLKNIPQDIHLVGKDTIWVVGDADLVLFSANAGNTWAKKDIGSNGYLTTIDVLPGGRCIVGGQTIIRYSSDGNTWQTPDTADLDFMWNVVGTIQGQDSAEVAITAHYDAIVADSTMRTIYTPGADDNASGCAAVLEAARLLEDHDWKHTLKFVLFSGEEVGLWGSCRYAYKPRNHLGFLNADMIAYDGNDDGMMEVHAFNELTPLSKETGEIFQDVVSLYDIKLSSNLDTTLFQRTDAIELWLARMPGTSIAEDMKGDFNPFYHSIEETIDKLNPGYFTETSKACVGWMAHMANLDALGVEEQIIPEPVEELVVLKLSSNILHSEGYLELSSPVTPVTPCIYDASGQRVKTLTSLVPSQIPTRIAFDISDLPAGVYWIGVKGTQGMVSERFVLIR